MAIKVADGNNARAAEVVMATVIESLLGLDDTQRQAMHALSDVTLKNWNGIEVGRLQASPGLRQALVGLG